MAVSTCVTSYFGLTHDLLQAGLADFASELTFWANVVRLDPQKFADEQRAEEYVTGQPGENEVRVNGSKPLIVGEHNLTSALDTQYQVDVSNLGVKSYRALSACVDQACKDHVDRQECLAWKGLYKDWSEEGTRRYLLAAHNFDHVATRLLRGAENEILDARTFAVRTLKALRLHKSPPRGTMPIEMVAQGINMSYRSLLLGPHLTSDTDNSSVPHILQEQARWFKGARTMYEGHVASEAAEIQKRCEPVERRSLEQLAEEEWQAYRDMLRDRMKEDIEFEVGDEFPCSGKIGPIAASLDLSKLGSGEGALSGTWEVKEGVGLTGNVNQEGTLGGSIDVGGHYGPFAGEGEATLTSRINPRSGEEDRGFKLTGEAGFGVEVHPLGGLDCYPSTGSVTFYPRAFMEDAIAYLQSSPSPR
jgi:hypothetical protein